MNVKERFLSTCEKDFINKAITGGIRHDGRTQYEFRDLSIVFGIDFGSVHVCLGETRILAQVTGEILPARNARPHEGILSVYLELGPMAAPHYEVNRQSDLSTLVNRALEKCLKDSKVINLEALCIRAGVKVWSIRLDLNVLNLDGNLVDAASIAALAALAHYQRPDVTLIGNEITIHKFHEKQPLPLIVQHYPVYVTYAFFTEGERIIADPTSLEERISEGQVSLAVNGYKELCGLHLEGNTPVEPDLVLKCSSMAAKRAGKVVELIKKKLAEDTENRRKNEVVGFNECLRLNKIPSYSEECITFQLRKYKKNKKFESEDTSTLKEEEIIEEPKINVVAENTAELIRDDVQMLSSDESADVEIIEPVKPTKMMKNKKSNERKDLNTKRPKSNIQTKEILSAKKNKHSKHDSDSEEEETMELGSNF